MARFRVVELERATDAEARRFIVIDTDKRCQIMATCSSSWKADRIAVALTATPPREEEEPF